MDNSADLARQLGEYDAKRRSSVDLLNEAMGKYGVPELRGRVSNLRTTLTNTENALNAVDPSVTGRTQGSLVTEAQRSKQVQNEQAPIGERYGQVSRSLGDANSNLSEQERAAQLLATSQLSDYEAGRSALAGRYQLAADREAEQRRREEEDRNYRLQLQEAQRQAAASSAYNFNQPATTPNQPTQPKGPDPQTQAAYNEVRRMIDSKDNARIQREYNAIKKSAGFGNAKDKVKLQILEQQYPWVKNFGRNAIPLQAAQPTMVSLNPTSSPGLGVTTATPQRLVVR